MHKQDSSSGTVAVKLDQSTRRRLKKLAGVKDRTAHWLMKEAIARYLEQEERYEQEKADDLSRWQNYVLRGEHLAQEEMMTWLDSLVESAARQS